MAKAGTTMVVPANLADISSMLAMAMGAMKHPHAVAEPKL